MTLEQEQLMPPPYETGKGIICKDLDKGNLQATTNNNNSKDNNKDNDSAKHNNSKQSKSRKRKESSLPLGERHLAVLRQELMVFLGNSGVLGSGMVVSMPSVTLNQLTDETQPFWLNKDEASWFGEYPTSERVLEKMV